MQTPHRFRFFKSFVFAGKGLTYAFRTQPNFRFEVMSALAVLTAGGYFGISRQEWIACILCIALVLLAELINTSLETLTDLVSPEYHVLAGRAKDLAAAAVFVSAFLAAVVGLIIFVPYMCGRCGT